MTEKPVNKTGTYVAFYVDETTKVNNNIQTAKDLCNYRTIEMWKATTDDFHFINSHDKTYEVRDDSEYETLLRRLKERLNLSKNMVLLLSSHTKQSRALKDEIECASDLGLPIIVVYIDIDDNDEIRSNGSLTSKVKMYWNKVPSLKSKIENGEITTLHIPFLKSYVQLALGDSDLTLNGKNKSKNCTYFYSK